MTTAPSRSRTSEDIGAVPVSGSFETEGRNFQQEQKVHGPRRAQGVGVPVNGRAEPHPGTVSTNRGIRKDRFSKAPDG